MITVAHLTTNESAAYYRKCDVRFHFKDKCDAKRAVVIREYFQRENLCNDDNHIVIAGVNKGQLSSVFLNKCEIALVGAEIQESVYQDVKARFRPRTNVRIMHAGWSSTNTILGIIGWSETARLTWNLSIARTTVNVYTLPTFMREVGLYDIPINYLVIDTEGHESHIIYGMQLELDQMQRMFNTFQYEVGEFWMDALPGYTQYDIARHLEKHGYDLYLIGCSFWWRVNADFFMPRVGAINTPPRCNLTPELTPVNKLFVWGNVLAIHKIYSRPSFRRLVVDSSNKHVDLVRRIK